MDEVILVNAEDQPIGTSEKMRAHENPAKRHRAFSVFVFNNHDELLLQRRGLKKKTWPGFWSNTCCSHPRPNEDTEQAAQRRLREELGFTCPLTFLFKFEYSARYDDTYGEHEVDWVFVGTYNEQVAPDDKEIEETRFTDIATLRNDMAQHPERYTPWFLDCFERVLAEHRNKT